MMNQNLLEMKHIYKSFDRTPILIDISLSIRKGELVALLGKNGAGKSTLIKILSGIYSKDHGEIVFANHGCITSAKTICRPCYHPISFMHQDLALVDWMTVGENIALSVGFPKNRIGLIQWKTVAKQAREALDCFGMKISVDQRILELSQIEKTIVSLARALANQAELLILDESTASLSTGEVSRLFSVLKELKSSGLGILYVTHRLKEVEEIADRAVLLCEGKITKEFPVLSYLNKHKMGEVIAGLSNLWEPCAKVSRKSSEASPEGRESMSYADDIILAVENLSTASVQHVDFSLRRGEILGLVGIGAAGHDSIGRTLFGLQKVQSGLLYLDGLSYSLVRTQREHSYLKLSPRFAIENQISLLAANRLHESIIASMTLEENLFLNPSYHGHLEWKGMRKKIIREKLARYTAELGIHPAHSNSPILSLSGGNQQKVVLARWIDIDNDILILEDPTAGLDVVSQSCIYQIFKNMLARGKSILLISSNLEEVMALSQRVLVFNQKQIVQELEGSSLTSENILLHASV